MTRPFTRLALLAAMAVGLAHAQPTTIEYWHISSATFGAQAVEQIVETFNEQNPDVQVVDRFHEGSYAGLLPNLQAAIASGHAPAVAQTEYNFGTFARSGLPHTALDALADVDGYQAYLGSFTDGLLGLGQDAEGTQHAIPLAISIRSCTTSLTSSSRRAWTPMIHLPPGPSP